MHHQSSPRTPRTWRHALVIASSLLAASAAQAIAVAPGQQTYLFSGNCQDCAAAAGTADFIVSATLTLANYVEGTALTDSNFVSFSYEGSNLLDPFDVRRDVFSDYVDGRYSHVFMDMDNQSLTGSLSTASGGAQTISMRFGDGLEFRIESDARWYTCGGKGGFAPEGSYYAVPCSWQANNDFGINGVLTPSAVPEPSSMVLMGLGLAGLGAVARRRKDDLAAVTPT